MSDTKIFSFPDGGGHSAFGGGSIMEGALLGSMMGNGGMFGGNAMMNNPWWALIFLAAFRNNGGLFGGNDGNGCGVNTQARFDALQEQLSTIQGQNALMSAIQGGTNEVKSLASTLNCDINAVQAAINAVQGAICNLSNTTNMNAQGIINAVTSGNRDIVNQLCSCCCGIKELVTEQGYQNQLATLNQTNVLSNGQRDLGVAVTKGFCDSAYATREQTCELKNAYQEGVAKILAGQRDAEFREIQREVQALRDERTQFQMSALLQQQSANLINQLRPCPIPAYITCNPFGCQGGLNDGYGYGYNNGGCNG